MPPAAATLLRRAPAVPFAARRTAVSRSGMARRLVTASAGAGGRAPAYGGLLLDAGWYAATGAFLVLDPGA